MKTKSFGLAGWIDILSNNDRRHVNTLPAKRGFTLAEVLITLGIIGTVAAMTLPALNTKIRQKIYSARLKTFYSTMRQVILLGENDFGSVDTWEKDTSNTEFIDKYFAPYMKFSKKSKNKYLCYTQGLCITVPTMELPNGTEISIHRGDCIDIIFDVNGNAPPNMGGKDLFMFLACAQNNLSHCGGQGFCTYGINSKNMHAQRDTYLQMCRTSPQTCSTLLKYDNWEFQNDYPY